MKGPNTRAFVALLLGTLLLPTGAAADSLYFFPSGREPNFNTLAHKKIDEYYRTILSMSARLKPISADEARSRSAESQAKANKKPTFNPVLDEANDLLWKGRELVSKKKFEKAVQPLSQAFDIYSENYDILRDMDNLVDASFNLAVAFYGAQFIEDAEDAIKRVVVMRPELTFQRSSVPAGFDDLFSTIQKKVLKRRSGPVVVDAVGHSVDVYLDGVLRGKTPVTLKDLPYGIHYVQVFAPGFAPWGKRFKAPKTSKSKRLEAVLEASGDGSVAAQPVADDDAARLAAVAQSGQFVGSFRADAAKFSERVGSDWLLFGYSHMEGKDYQYSQFLYSKKHQATVQAGFAVFAKDLSDLQVKALILEDQLYTAVTAFASKQKVVAVPAVYQRQSALTAVGVAPIGGTVTGPGGSGSPVVTGPRGGGAKPRFKIIPYGGKGAGTHAPLTTGPAWYENKWVWIGVGSAVLLAGAGVGTYFLLQGDDDGGGYKATLTW